MRHSSKQVGLSLMWIAAGLVPALFVAFLYSPTLDYGLVWDDHVLTTASVYTRQDIAAILTGPANGYEYLPVRDLSLMLDHAVHGGWWGGFHQTSLILFAVATFLVYLFLARLFLREPDIAGGNRPYLLALACTMVFALHPLNVEPVAFIATRNAVLALCFSLAACLAIEYYEQKDSRFSYWLGLIFLMLALLSKATAVFLPMVFVLLAMHQNREYSLVSAMGRYVPHLAVTAIMFSLHLLIASQAALKIPLTFSGFLTRLHNVIFIPEFYLFKFLWPFNLIIDYPYGDYFDHKLLLMAGSAFLLFIVVRIFITEYRQRSIIWFLLLSYLVALMPVMNLIPTTPPVADRYAQIPLLFLVPLLLVLLYRKLNLRVFVVTCLLGMFGLAVLTSRQVTIWESDMSLFSHTLASNPSSIKALHNLGIRQWIEGDKQQALDYFSRATEIDPEDLTHDFYLGRYAEEKGDVASAKRHYLAALDKQGKFLYLAYLKLGLLYAGDADYTGARKALQKSIELAGTSPQDEANKRAARDAIARIERIQKQRLQ